MEDDGPPLDGRENPYLGAVKRPVDWFPWVAIALMMVGMFSFVLRFTADTLEQLEDKDTDRLIAEVYEPWKVQFEESFRALKIADRDLNEGKSDRAKFISDVKTLVRPGLVKALTTTERFVARTKTIEKVKNHFLTETRRSIRYIDDLLDGVSRDDRESLIRTNQAYADYATGSPQRWQELLRSCGIDLPLPRASPK